MGRSARSRVSPSPPPSLMGEAHAGAGLPISRASISLTAAHGPCLGSRGYMAPPTAKEIRIYKPPNLTGKVRTGPPADRQPPPSARTPRARRERAGDRSCQSVPADPATGWRPRSPHGTRDRASGPRASFQQGAIVGLDREPDGLRTVLARPMARWPPLAALRTATWPRYSTIGAVAFRRGSSRRTFRRAFSGLRPATGPIRCPTRSMRTAIRPCSPPTTQASRNGALH